jgi:hypothetical protein
MITTKALSERAATGDADAQFRLGYRLAFARNPHLRDLPRAADLWRSASKRGHVRARFYLGTCYDLGRGVRKNRRIAMTWYEQAALAGLSAAQYNLALGYRDGHGVKKSPSLAARWFEAAAKAGDADAQADFGFCLHEGFGVPKNPREAVRWYRRAAKKGVTRAGYNLGLCYRDGDGVTRSIVNALRWFRWAAERGHELARGEVESSAARGRAGEKRDAMHWLIQDSGGSALTGELREHLAAEFHGTK